MSPAFYRSLQAIQLSVQGHVLCSVWSCISGMMHRRMMSIWEGEVCSPVQAGPRWMCATDSVFTTPFCTIVPIFAPFAAVMQLNWAVLFALC